MLRRPGGSNHDGVLALIADRGTIDVVPFPPDVEISLSVPRGKALRVMGGIATHELALR
jgi:hypothetical protein